MMMMMMMTMIQTQDFLDSYSHRGDSYNSIFILQIQHERTHFWLFVWDCQPRNEIFGKQETTNNLKSEPKIQPIKP
jgi:hypothetical protein